MSDTCPTLVTKNEFMSQANLDNSAMSGTSNPDSAKPNNVKVDTKQRRATYSLPYPPDNSQISVVSFDDLKNHCVIDKQITQKRIEFKFHKKTLENYAFTQCQFFKDGASKNNFKEITFRGCRFDQCFIGSVEFTRVRFEKCTFSNVDFSRTVFDHCTFDTCTFKKISCYHGIFIATELDSMDFFKGIELFTNHFKTESEEGKKEFDIHKIEFGYNKLVLAKHIYSSNNGIDNHRLSDRSLVQLKFVEFESKISNLKKAKFSDLWDYKFYLNLVQLFFTGCNLLFTKGGTSLTRLALSTIILLFLFNWSLGFTTITYSLNDSQVTFGAFFNDLPSTLSIFFGYGYTGFKTHSPVDLFWLNLIVGVGLLFYALLISVFIRKTYK